MAEQTLLSPGVLARENDQSFIGARPVTYGAAIIGPATKGPVGIPTAVSTFSQYEAIFGSTVESGSQFYTYLNSISARNYFAQGGESLLMTRVVSGSFDGASSSIPSSITEGKLVTGVDALLSSVNVSPVINITGSTGGTVNNVPVGGGSGNSAIASIDIAAQDVDATVSTITSITITTEGIAYEAGDVINFTSESLGATKPNGADLTVTLTESDLQNIGSFTIKTISEGVNMNNSQVVDGANGTLTNGTNDNIRWEVASVNTASGQFSLLVRRGNDTSTSKTVLETYNNLSLDPTAPNYISNVIGDTYYEVAQDGTDYFVKTLGNYPQRSAYIYVENVNKPTPQYFDNNGQAKSEFTSSLPNITVNGGSGSFSGATGDNVTATNSPVKFNENISGTNIQGLIMDNYTQSINLLSNSDDYQFNVITAPGLNSQLHSNTVTRLVTLAQGRTDCIAVIDVAAYNSQINAVTTEATKYDSSYAATYWPWLQTVDAGTGQTVWAPASTYIPAVYAFTDASSDPWFAPAGLIRGALGSVVRAERKLTSGNRDTLYEANVNPIATFPGSGVVVFGQKTLQKRASALDRVNVRRLLIALKGYISQVSDNLVFEQNTNATRNNFLANVNPYLESVQQRQGLYAFKVVMDATNNTPDVIDRNELVGQIYLQPTKTAEFVILDFNVLPTGATFPE
ncbi:phage tail sheath subtilisin-like domain-containing protein [bacterium]|nr:phage tail sheath subtilisin-like domain-containing protein [bacterium]